MRAAIQEARKGMGKTSPNPTVGAVIVKSGRILARGWHHKAGKPHAEIEAMRALPSKVDAQGATLYVTLEPCSTHGRTPPCTEAIIHAGFRRVVYGATDPNPAHAGRAADILREHGIQVVSEVLASECNQLNEGWNYWIRTGRPFVIAKFARSLDGCIDNPVSRRWLTSPEARQDAMQLRAQVDAILIGGQTARQDNPRLTVRGIPGSRQPWRVVWLNHSKLSPNLHLLSDSHKDRTLIFEGSPLADVLGTLGALKVTSVLIEGGGNTLGFAFDQRLVNKVVGYVAPLLQGGRVPAVAGLGVADNVERINLTAVTYRKIGRDLAFEGLVTPTL